MKPLVPILVLLASTWSLAEEKDIERALAALEEASRLWSEVDGQVLEISGNRETTVPEGGERRMTQKADLLTHREIGGARILVHYRPVISQWIEGARDYYLEHMSIGFDGVRGFTVMEKEGGFPDARILDTHQITLLKRPREFTTIQHDNGLGAFLPFQRIPGVEPVLELSRFGGIVRQDHCRLTVEEDENGVHLEFLFGDPDDKHDRYSFHLDPKKGYALVGMKQVFGASPRMPFPFTNSIQCEDFAPIEGSRDLYFPRRCRFRITSDNFDYDTRLEIDSAELRPLEAGEFEAPRPDGWTIYDAATERRWTVGERR